MKLQHFANKKPQDLSLQELLTILPTWGLTTSAMDESTNPDRITICVSGFENEGARCYITLHIKKNLLESENLSKLVNVFYLAGKQQYLSILDAIECFDVEATGFKNIKYHFFVSEYKCAV